MSVTTTRYVRKPLYVDAVQVTKENMVEVAAWCRGTIEKDDEDQDYIKIDVIRPQRVRQGQAYVADYVLKSSGGYKVFTPKAFKETFVPMPRVDRNEVKVQQEVIPSVKKPESITTT